MLLHGYLFYLKRYNESTIIQIATQPPWETCFSDRLHGTSRSIHVLYVCSIHMFVALIKPLNTPYIV